MGMDVVISGADGEVGRTIAEAFHQAGHRLVVMGVRPDDLTATATASGADAVVCDCSDPADLASAQGRLPHHLDAIVVVPAAAWISVDPRTATLADSAVAWRSAFDRTVVSTMLTVQTVSEHLRSGGSIVVALPPCDTGPEAAAKAALSDWTSAQANHFGISGITVNTIAAGRTAQPGYDGIAGTPAPWADEMARMALFLTTPAARHITGQTLHVGRGAAVTYG
jgi:NAD(P)-dependent dehydrogenase (short-subunit alcohol dehydrogenase family)